MLLMQLSMSKMIIAFMLNKLFLFRNLQIENIFENISKLRNKNYD